MADPAGAPNGPSVHLHDEIEATAPLPHPGMVTTQLDDLRRETEQIREDVRVWFTPTPRPTIERRRAHDRLVAHAGLAPRCSMHWCGHSWDDHDGLGCEGHRERGHRERGHRLSLRDITAGQSAANPVRARGHGTRRQGHVSAVFAGTAPSATAVHSDPHDPAHHPTLMTTSRNGSWATCICGWRSAVVSTTTGAHLAFGQYLLEARRG